MEDHRNKRAINSNSTAPPYPQYNSGGNAQQNKPPRFQRNQESQHQYQHNGGREAHQRPSQPNDYRNSFAQSRTSSTNVGDSGNNENYNRSQADTLGKTHLGSNRNYNHVEPDVRNKHPYDASYGRHNRAPQDGASKVYSSNATEKNFKNQQPKYQANHNDNRMNLNAQRSESNQNTNVSASSTWMWRVGDKCMAKYWEDNRVRAIFLLTFTRDRHYCAWEIISPFLFATNFSITMPKSLASPRGPV